MCHSMTLKLLNLFITYSTGGYMILSLTPTNTHEHSRSGLTPRESSNVRVATASHSGMFVTNRRKRGYIVVTLSHPTSTDQYTPFLRTSTIRVPAFTLRPSSSTAHCLCLLPNSRSSSSTSVYQGFRPRIKARSICSDKTSNWRSL